MQTDTAGAIRDALSMPQVVRFYGLEPNRAGFLLCPFHGEKTPSFKVYDRQFCCFGCGKKGSVIDFVMELFGLGFQDALKRLDTDFSLGFTDAPVDRSAVMERRRNRLRAEAAKDAARREYRRKTEEFRACHEAINRCAPDENGEISEEFAQAVKRMPELEYWFDTHECPK